MNPLSENFFASFDPGDVERVLIIRVMLPSLPPFPENNFIGAEILKTYLLRELEFSDLLAKGAPGLVGALNFSFFSVYVNDTHAASRKLIEVLKVLSLESYVSIYTLDGSEGVLRCLFPKSGDMVEMKEINTGVALAAAAHRVYMQTLVAIVTNKSLK